MLYTDFFFRMRRRDAICIAGWTTGAVGKAALIAGEHSLPASAQLCFLRSDLPPGATGFILRFELGGEIIDSESAKLRLEDPSRTAPFPAASANLDALITSATDDLFTALLVGVIDGMFAIEEPSAIASLHKRAVAVAGNRVYCDMPAAAVAQDAAMVFVQPQRVLVTGWLGHDGSAPAPQTLAAVFDAQGMLPLDLYPDSVIRPDLAGTQLRGISLGAASGYVGLARLDRPLGANPVCLIGMIHEGSALCTLRPAQPMGAAELGRQYDHLRRNMVHAERSDEILAHLLPSLPDYADLGTAEHVARPDELSGLAYVIEHDIDHWLSRDVLRLVRKAGGDLRQITMVTEGTSEGMIRATLADRTEAGDSGPRVEIMGINTALARWAPAAQHLIFSTSALLFQVDAFPILSRARADGLPAMCLVLTDSLDPGLAAIPFAEGIAALIAGQPFIGQLDQSLVEPVILPQSLHLSQAAQMRWLLIALARNGLVTFVAASGLGYLPGRDPVPAQNRLIELRAMRQAAEETVQ